jgi:hypothetical protein
LASVLPHDRGGRLQPNTDGAALVDKGTLGGNAPHDILGRQYRRHPATTLRRPQPAISTLKRSLIADAQLLGHDPGDWHLAGGAADAQTLSRQALEESAARAEELVAAGDDNGAAVWRRMLWRRSRTRHLPGTLHWPGTKKRWTTTFRPEDCAPVKGCRTARRCENGRTIGGGHARVQPISIVLAPSLMIELSSAETNMASELMTYIVWEEQGMDPLSRKKLSAAQQRAL